MKTDLIERLRAHPHKAVVRHWEDWAQEAGTLMLEAAAALEAEASKGERMREAALSESRNAVLSAIYHDERDADVAYAAILDLIPEAPAREAE